MISQSPSAPSLPKAAHWPEKLAHYPEYAQSSADHRPDRADHRAEHRARPDQSAKSSPKARGGSSKARPEHTHLKRAPKITWSTPRAQHRRPKLADDHPKHAQNTLKTSADDHPKHAQTRERAEDRPKRAPRTSATVSVAMEAGLQAGWGDDSPTFPERKTPRKPEMTMRAPHESAQG